MPLGARTRASTSTEEDASDRRAPPRRRVPCPCARRTCPSTRGRPRPTTRTRAHEQPLRSLEKSGGSSGGEAALHAVDDRPSGSDQRALLDPGAAAHFGGTVGLRPSVGRVPETGAWPTTRDSGMLDMATLGPMGGTVKDVALLLLVIAGPDGIDQLASGSEVGDPDSCRRLLSPASATTRTTERVRPPPARGGDRGGGARPAEAERRSRRPRRRRSRVGPDLASQMMAADGGRALGADLAAGGGISSRCRWLLRPQPFELSAAGYFRADAALDRPAQRAAGRRRLRICLPSGRRAGTVLHGLPPQRRR